MRTWQCWHKYNTLDLLWKCAVANPQRDIKVFCIEVKTGRERGKERGECGFRDRNVCVRTKHAWSCGHAWFVCSVFITQHCFHDLIFWTVLWLLSITSLQRSISHSQYFPTPHCRCRRGTAEFFKCTGELFYLLPLTNQTQNTYFV